MIKVQQMSSPKSHNPVANQFIITTEDGRYFQSYNSIIAFVPKKVSLYDETCEQPIDTRIQLDKHYWDYSRTTGKYRNKFLGENTAETRKKINSGEYVLTNLNSND